MNDHETTRRRAISLCDQLAGVIFDLTLVAPEGAAAQNAARADAHIAWIEEALTDHSGDFEPENPAERPLPLVTLVKGDAVEPEPRRPSFGFEPGADGTLDPLTRMTLETAVEIEHAIVIADRLLVLYDARSNDEARHLLQVATDAAREAASGLEALRELKAAKGPRRCKAGQPTLFIR